MWQDGSLLRDTYVTGLETVLGFVIGNVLGTALGLSLWYSRFVSRVVQPFIIALGSIPIIALAPIVIIWFGTGLASKIAMSTLSVVVVALVTSYKGAMSVDPDQVNLMRTLGARKSQIFRKLVVPASLTDIFAGLKLTVGFALIGAIIGEFMSSSEGLGHAIFKAGSALHHPKSVRGPGRDDRARPGAHLDRRQARAAAHALAPGGLSPPGGASMTQEHRQEGQHQIRAVGQRRLRRRGRARRGFSRSNARSTSMTA